MIMSLYATMYSIIKEINIISKNLTRQKDLAPYQHNLTPYQKISTYQKKIWHL